MRVQHDEDGPQNLKAQHVVRVQERHPDVHQRPRDLGDLGLDDVLIPVRQFLVERGLDLSREEVTSVVVLDVRQPRFRHQLLHAVHAPRHDHLHGVVLVHVHVPKLHHAVHSHLQTEVDLPRRVHQELVPADAEKLKRLSPKVVRDELEQEPVRGAPDRLTRESPAHNLVQVVVVHVGKRLGVRVVRGGLERRRVLRDGDCEVAHRRVAHHELGGHAGAQRLVQPG